MKRYDTLRRLSIQTLKKYFMKKYMMILVMVSISVFMTSCSSDDLSDLTVPETEDLVAGTGSWKVTYFYDKDKDETSDFNGWTFTFNDDGTLTASKGSETYTGSWNIKSSDDDPDYDKEIVIIITGAYPLDEMSDDWIIIELTDSNMKLKDDSDDGIEELHLQAV